MPSFTSGRCPICSGTHLRAIGAVPAAGSRILPPAGSRIVACAGCDLLFVDPLPHWTDEDFAVLYGDTYFAPFPEWWQAVRERREPARRFGVIAPHLRTPERRVLEVGAGVYGFMARHLAARGWQATAQEPALAFHPQLRGHEPRMCVTATPFLELPADERYGLVFADSVLEHVPNPLDYFAKARELLVPGGVLYLVSPNEHAIANHARTLVRRATTGEAAMLCPYRESFHLVGYTRRALERAAALVGLELVVFAKSHDWRWLHELHGTTSPLRYPRAALRLGIDLVGGGHNLEALLRRPP